VSPRYRLTPNAQENVDTICAFIADDSVAAALRVWDSLEQAFEQLAQTPEIGHTREDLTDRPVKFWNVFSYLIVYDPTSVPLNIIAVLHGARDVEHLLKDIDR
jgi:plasmid stabilization system protein ParE